METSLLSDTRDILLLVKPRVQRQLHAPSYSCQVCPTKMGSHGCGSPFHCQLLVGMRRESYKTSTGCLLLFLSPSFLSEDYPKTLIFCDGL